MTRSRYIGLLLIPLILLVALISVSPAKASSVTGKATLEIPALKIRAVIVESYLKHTPDGDFTWDVASLGNKVGHLEGTPWLTDSTNKNIVLAGHNTLPNGNPAIFYTLNHIRSGDRIILSEGDVTAVYIVTNQQLVDPSDTGVLLSTGKDQLTLLTCAGAYDVQTDDYLKRLVVTAIRAS